MSTWVRFSRWLWLFLVFSLLHAAQILLHREVLPYAGTLVIAALLGHAASWSGRPLSSLDGLDPPQLAGLGGLAALMAAATAVDHRNGGYGWPIGFGPTSGAEAILPAVLAAVLLPVAVVGAILVATDAPSTCRQRMPVASGAVPTSHGRLRRAGIALLRASALSIGLLGAAAGVPMRSAEAPVLVCVSIRTPCAQPTGTLLVTAPERQEPEMDRALRQFAVTGDRARLIDDMRSFAGRAGGEGLRVAAVRFLETPGETRLTQRTAQTILGAMDIVCDERRTPTLSLWMSGPTPPLTAVDRDALESWLAAQDSAVFDLKIISYIYAYCAWRANWSAARETALLLVGLGLVVRRVFPA
jgi:hypothetical protein